MSLSSFLLGANASKGKGKAIDTGLDNLFRSTDTRTEAARSSPSVKKRKDAPTEVPPVSKSAKRSKRDSDSRGDAAQSQAHSSAVPEPSRRPASGKRPHKIEPVESDSGNASGSDTSGDESEESDGDEEGDASTTQPATSPAKAPNAAPHSDSESDDEGDPSQLVHESVAKGAKGSKSNTRAMKYVPVDETPAQRDTRTIFIGNVPVEVVKSRPLQKQLKKHILSFVPTAKIESARFRSVAFNKPTTKLPSEGSSTSQLAQPAKDGRQHDRERAASWRQTNSRTSEDAAADAGKTFLTPKEKKRIAFIKQEIHAGVDSVNAYIVFAHPTPEVDGKPQRTPRAMDPYEAAKAAINEADGSVFMEHTIRVDSAVKGAGRSTELGLGGADIAGDPKATIFVGNLDFASKEEDVRAFFEGLMVVEKGLEGASQVEEKEESDEDESEKGSAAGGRGKAALKTWVKRVRLIRDKGTLLGKGFGYVQFNDRSCVDEILALEPQRLKFAKRKLRVQRCKTLPGGTKQAKIPSSKPATDRGKPERPQAKPYVRVNVPIPKGDPALGAKLASLSKDERKKVKAADADRLARRLAKKKAKVLAEKGVKSHDTERERVRKRPRDSVNKASVDKGKKRVRSNKALMKMNTKK